ncbi:unnamed protein product, partial [Ectocarpus sp. 12 AP-2014]
MARLAGTPYKAFLALKEHFLPLSQSQIRAAEEESGKQSYALMYDVLALTQDAM